MKGYNGTNSFAFPITEETVTLEVSFDEYYKKLTDQCAFKLSCLGKVEQTGHEYFAQDDFRCRKPDIKIEVRRDGGAQRWWL